MISLTKYNIVRLNILYLLTKCIVFDCENGNYLQNGEKKAWCKACVKEKRKGYACVRNPWAMFFVCLYDWR